MKSALSKFVKGIGFLFTLFFSSGLEPWAVKLDSRSDHVENDDIDFLLDIAQFYEVSLEPLPQDH
jgi:hypothetical protein